MEALPGAEKKACGSLGQAELSFSTGGKIPALTPPVMVAAFAGLTSPCETRVATIESFALRSTWRGGDAGVSECVQGLLAQRCILDTGRLT
jgi:hypothetical protein